MTAVTTYSRGDIEQALSHLEFSSGCTVFLTAGFGFLGQYEGDDVYRDFIEELESRIGSDGTIIVPTYSYSFGDVDADEGCLPRFCIKETPSKLGHFSEWFRRTMAGTRSRDPMVSVALKGSGVERLTRGLPPTSYGYGSLFERLLDEDAIVLNVGLGTKWTPFIHYVDFLCDVPHRYEKRFRGVIDYGPYEETVSWVYHVPIRVPNARGLGERNGLAALEAGLWRYAALGRARIFASNYKEYFHFSLERSRNDSWNLAAGPPIDLAAVHS